MQITNEWLKEHGACIEGYKWSQSQTERELKPFLMALVADDHFNWANWVIVRCMDKVQKVKYAVFAAEQVIDIYEKIYPNDKRPRKAIESAKAYIDNPTYAYAAAYAANAAYAAADAADAYAYAAACAAAANADAYAAAAAYAAADAAADAADAADAAIKNELRLKILQYGISLIKG